MALGLFFASRTIFLAVCRDKIHMRPLPDMFTTVPVIKLLIFFPKNGTWYISFFNYCCVPIAWFTKVNNYLSLFVWVLCLSSWWWMANGFYICLIPHWHRKPWKATIKFLKLRWTSKSWCRFNFIWECLGVPKMFIYIYEKNVLICSTKSIYLSNCVSIK